MKLLLVMAAAAAALAAEPLPVPFFRQQVNGCGAASVAMVMHYWKPGAPSADEVYSRLYLPERKGIPLADMRRYLEGAGFRAFTLRGQGRDIDEHLAKGRPIIVGIKTRRSGRLHFAVLSGIEGDSLWLNDPTRKKPKRVKRSDFEKQWELADRWMLLTSPAADTPGSFAASRDSSGRPPSAAR